MQITSSVQSAIDTCVAFGNKYQREHAVVLLDDKNQEILCEANGGEATSVGYSVSFNDEQVANMIRDRSIIVHNHPICSSLSKADLLLASQCEATIIAADVTGSIYTSHGFKGLNKISNEDRDVFKSLNVSQVKHKICDRMNCSELPINGYLYSSIEHKVVCNLSARVRMEYIPEEDLQILASHITNIIAHRKGLLKDYDYILSSVTEKAIDRLQKYAPCPYL